MNFKNTFFPLEECDLYIVNLHFAHLGVKIFNKMLLVSMLGIYFAVLVFYKYYLCKSDYVDIKC